MSIFFLKRIISLEQINDVEMLIFFIFVFVLFFVFFGLT